MLEEEKTDSESSCLLFEKEKRLSERMELRLQKICLEIPSAGVHPFCPSDIFLVSSGKFTGQNDKTIGFVSS